MFQKRKLDLHFCPAISEKVLPMAVATPQASYFVDSSTLRLLDSGLWTLLTLQILGNKNFTKTTER